MKPKLLTTLKDYSWRLFLGDALAGITVALVALPLSIAIAIASGATPQAGLVTAIIGGFLISLLGGSKVQIGGPTGAFIVVVAGVIARFGFDGLLLATLLAGVILVVGGLVSAGQVHLARAGAGDRRVHRRHRADHCGESAKGSAWLLGRSSASGSHSWLACFMGRTRPIECMGSSRRDIRDPRYRPSSPSHSLVSRIVAYCGRRFRGGRVGPTAGGHDLFSLRRPSCRTAAASRSAFEHCEDQRAVAVGLLDRFSSGR